MTGTGTGGERPGRRGFTLAELLIALVLFAVVATAATRVMRIQQRFLRGAAELGEMRSQLRQAIHVLPSELRWIAPASGDVHEWSSSAMKFRSLLGASVVCRKVSDSVIVVPPRASAGGDLRVLTTWLVMPQPGDSILVLDEGDLGAFDDTWRVYEIAAAGPAGDVEGCEPTTGFDAYVPGAGPPLRLRVASESSLSPGIRAGAAIRLFHPVRYALYRSGDANWYLGAADCSATRVPRCSSIQPISGPYGSRGRTALDGLTLTFESASGRTLTPGIDDLAEIAVIRVAVRGETEGSWWGTGRGFRTLDSLELDVAVRGGSTSLVGTGR